METPVYNSIFQAIRQGSVFFSNLSKANDYYQFEKKYYDDEEVQRDDPGHIYNYPVAFESEYLKIINALEKAKFSIYSELDQANIFSGEVFKKISGRLLQMLFTEFERHNEVLKLFDANLKPTNIKKLEFYLDRLDYAQNNNFRLSRDEWRKNLQEQKECGAEFDNVEEELLIVIEYVKSKTVSPSEYLNIYLITIWFLVTTIQKSITEINQGFYEDNINDAPVDISELMYPAKTAHKMLMLDRLGILTLLKDQFNNTDNGNLSRLIAVIINERSDEGIETIRKGISNINKLINPTSEKKVETLLSQFITKTKKSK